MANKKCPKCGEDNPAEAVMCWACYTPLTAGAGAAMGAGVGMGGAGAATLPRPGGPMGAPVPTDAGEKKQIDPKIFLVCGLFLVGGVIALFTTGIISSGPPPMDMASTTTTTDTDFGARPGSGGTTVSVGPIQPPPPPTGGGGGEIGGPVAPPAPSFSMVVSPNPRFSTATFGIAPSSPNASPQQALNLAKSARQSVLNGSKWKNAQIVVFRDAASASTFRSYMGQRRGEPINGNDFAALAGQGAWAGALVYYETRGSAGKVYYPSANPTHWW